MEAMPATPAAALTACAATAVSGEASHICAAAGTLLIAETAFDCGRQHLEVPFVV